MTELSAADHRGFRLLMDTPFVKSAFQRRDHANLWSIWNAAIPRRLRSLSYRLSLIRRFGPTFSFALISGRASRNAFICASRFGVLAPARFLVSFFCASKALISIGSQNFFAGFDDRDGGD
jgi:hypothetical protein